MTTVSISTGQRKILERFRPGVRLMLDSRTGLYSFFEGDTVTAVDQRPVEAMLRSGVIEKDAMGQCYVKPDLDIAGSLAIRKTHLAGTDGRPSVCRYTKHPRARATWVPSAQFVQLLSSAQCPDCVTRLTTPN